MNNSFVISLFLIDSSQSYTKTKTNKDRIRSPIFLFLKMYTCIIELLPKALSRQNHSNPHARGSYFSFVRCTSGKVESDPQLSLHHRDLPAAHSPFSRSLLPTPTLSTLSTTRPSRVLYPWLPSAEYSDSRSSAESSSNPADLRNIPPPTTATAPPPTLMLLLRSSCP